MKRIISTDFLGQFERIRIENDFLILEKVPSQEKIIRADSYFRNFEEEVADGFNSNLSDLLQKLSNWESDNENTYVVVRQRKRNPYIKSLALLRANGNCERCNQKAPFFKPDKTPFLEVHHLVMLAHDGDDSIANTIALCPNCHREMHYGEISLDETEDLKKKIIRKNSVDK